MQPLVQIANEIIKDLTGGRFGDILDVNTEDVYNKIHAVRGQLIVQKFYKDQASYINPQWLQVFYPVYDSTIQIVDAPFVQFPYPPVVDSALILFGSQNGQQDFAITDDSQINTFMDNKYTKPLPNRMVGVVGVPYFKVYGNLAYKNKGKLYVVAANPMEIPTYSFDFATQTYTITGLWDDERNIYPISNDLLPLLKQQVKQELLNILTRPMVTKISGNPNEPIPTQQDKEV